MEVRMEMRNGERRGSAAVTTTEASAGPMHRGNVFKPAGQSGTRTPDCRSSWRGRTEQEESDGMGISENRGCAHSVLMNCLVLVATHTRTRTAWVQFCANWREMKLLTMNDQRAVRTLEDGMLSGRSVHEAGKEVEKSRKQQHRYAAVPDETSGAGIKRIRREKGRPGVNEQATEVDARPKQRSTGDHSGKRPGDTGILQPAMRDENEGITGQVLVRARKVVSRWGLCCAVTPVLRVWGRSVSRARALARREKKKMEMEEKARQQGTADNLLALLVFRYGSGVLVMSTLEEQVCALRQSLPLATVGAVDHMIVQSRCVRAVITGFATGLRWASVERAFTQMRSGWEDNERKWRACCVPALTMVVERGKMKRAVLQLVFNWTGDLEQQRDSSEHCGLQIEIKEGRDGKKKKNRKRRMEKRRLQEIKGRLWRSQTGVRVWETLEKAEIGFLVRAVPPSAGQQDEVPKVRCDR
jgi:hypothetical protein